MYINKLKGVKKIPLACVGHTLMRQPLHHLWTECVVDFGNYKCHSRLSLDLSRYLFYVEVAHVENRVLIWLQQTFLFFPLSSLILALCPVIFQNSPLDYLCFRFCSWSFGWYLFISNNLWKSNFASILSSFDFLFSPWVFC